MNNSDSLEFSELKVCGMQFTFEDLTSKLVRLFKLGHKKCTSVTIEQIMEAIQDGNQNFDWFKEK